MYASKRGAFALPAIQRHAGMGANVRLRHYRAVRKRGNGIGQDRPARTDPSRREASNLVEWDTDALDVHTVRLGCWASLDLAEMADSRLPNFHAPSIRRCGMTPEEMERERLAGPRALTFGCLGGIIFWGLVLFGIATGAFAATYRLFAPAVAHGGGPQYQACAYTPRLPIALHIGPGVDAPAWRWALDDWQRHYPGTFVESPTSGPGIVEIVADTALWVDMPCEGREARIHSNSHGGSLAYWAPHELGHVLALRDLIRADTANPEKYINPGRCPSAEYNGMMSYCATILDWWGADDDRMMAAIRDP